MKSEGAILKYAVERSGRTAGQVAKDAGISRPTLYILYKQKTIEPLYIKKLSSAGIDIKNAIMHDNAINELEVSILKEKLKIAHSEIAYLKSLIKDLTRKK